MTLRQSQAFFEKRISAPRQTTWKPECMQAIVLATKNAAEHLGVANRKGQVRGGMKEELSFSICFLRWPLTPLCGRLAPHQWPLGSAECTKGVGKAFRRDLREAISLAALGQIFQFLPSISIPNSPHTFPSPSKSLILRYEYDTNTISYVTTDILKPLIYKGFSISHFLVSNSLSWETKSMWGTCSRKRPIPRTI